MKKILSLALLVAALPFAMVSCSDDDNLPKVDYDISFSGATLDNGTLYVVQGDTLKVNSITVKNQDSDKNAGLTNAEYFWDYYFVGNSPLPPFNFSIATNQDTPLGEHALTIRMGVVAVDKEPAVGVVDYPVMVVADSTQLPSSPQPVVK